MSSTVLIGNQKLKMISDFPILYTVPQNYISFNYCPIFQLHYVKKKKTEKYFSYPFSLLMDIRVPVIALLPNHHYVLHRKYPSLSSSSKFSDIVDIFFESFSSFASQTRRDTCLPLPFLHSLTSSLSTSFSLYKFFKTVYQVGGN